MLERVALLTTMRARIARFTLAAAAQQITSVITATISTSVDDEQGQNTEHQ